MKIPAEIAEGLEWSTHREKQKGGQQAGLPNWGAKLTHKELGFEISTDAFRSQMQCRNFCQTVFELFLMELNIK